MEVHLHLHHILPCVPPAGPRCSTCYGLRAERASSACTPPADSLAPIGGAAPAPPSPGPCPLRLPCICPRAQQAALDGAFGTVLAHGCRLEHLSGGDWGLLAETLPDIGRTVQDLMDGARRLPPKVKVSGVF
jgi:hypothetical protein